MQDAPDREAILFGLAKFLDREVRPLVKVGGSTAPGSTMTQPVTQVPAMRWTSAKRTSLKTSPA